MLQYKYMIIIRKYRAILVLILLATVGVFFFFSRLYRHDISALEGFVSSYETFDKAISDFSIGKTADLENKSDAALIELGANANVRISSLIKNESKVMSYELEIADLSKKELDGLKFYIKAEKNKNVESNKLAKKYNDLTNKRKDAYTHFQQLSD